MEKQKEKKSSTGKYILIGLGVVALAGTAYYFISRPKATSGLDDFTTLTEDEPEPVRSPSETPSGSSAGFPLKKGSRGDLVKNIQEMLILKYGKDILPKYGADGQWGTELENALKSKGFPTTIDANTFTQLLTVHSTPVNSTKTSTTPEIEPGFHPTDVALNLFTAIVKADFNTALVSLKKIQNPKGYAKVNEAFKKRTGVPDKSVLSALLTKFSQGTNAEKLKEQFNRMGLKYDGKQWTLAGAGQALSNQIKTVLPTRVWNEKGQAIHVPRGTVLGAFMTGKNGVTKFQTIDGKILFTNTKCIAYV